MSKASQERIKQIRAQPDKTGKIYGKKYDWDSISAEYIQGYFLTDPETGVRKHIYPSLEDLAHKHGCAWDTIRKKCATDQWVLKRSVFKAKIKEHITDRQVSTFLSESAQHDALTLDKVRKLHKLLDYQLRKYDEILNSEFGEDFDPENAINLRDLDSMTQILSRMHNLVRSVVGEPVNVSDKNALIQDLNVLNPALSKMDTKARKEKISELQSRLTLTKQQKKALANITNDQE